MDFKIPKSQRITAVLSAALLLITSPLQVQAMGFLDFARIYIFSEVDGVVTLDDEKPVKGAKVIRTADFRDKLHTHVAITDEQGRFHFDDIYTYSLRLSETAILQKIVIQHEGEEYLAWKLLKRNDHRYGELNDLKTMKSSIIYLNLRCDLSEPQDSEQMVGSDLRRRIITGICRWD